MSNTVMEKIRVLTRELEKARDKIARICKWIRQEHGIIIPVYILNPDSGSSDGNSNGDRVDTTTNRKIEFVEIEGVNLKSEQYDENDDLSSIEDTLDHLLPSEFDENYIEETPLPSKLPSKDVYPFQKCKPCYVLLPLRVDHQPHVDIDQIKSSPWPNQNKLKTKPTIDERIRALYICQSYFTKITKSPIICPIVSCSHYFAYTKNTKDLFRRHLVRMHFFQLEDTKKPIRFTSDNTVAKIVIMQKKPEPKLKPSLIEKHVGIKSSNIDKEQNSSQLGPTTTTANVAANNIFLIQYPVVSPTTLQVENQLHFVKLLDPVPGINVLNKDTENGETSPNSSAIQSTIRSESNQDQVRKCNAENTSENIEETYDVIKNWRQNWRQNWRERKKRPTKEEKSKALHIYKTFSNFLDVKCPICSTSIKSGKNCRSSIKRHLIRMHYFDEKELKEPYKKRDVHQNGRKNWLEERKKRPTEAEKSSALNIYKNSSSFLDVKCPICSISIKSSKNSRSAIKLHLIRMHYFDEKELNEPYKKRDQPKTQLTDGQKLQVLKILQDYSNSQDNDGDNDNDGKPIVCPVCPKRQFSPDDHTSMGLNARFKSHLRIVHMFTKNDFLMCKIVQDHPVNPSERSKRRRSRGRCKKGFLCTICGKIYRHSYLLKKHHVKNHSTQEPTFQCVICNTFFHYQSDLNMHKKIHTTTTIEKKFICQVCGSTFKRLSYLQDHLHIHSEDRTYKCENCEKTFKQVQALHGHIKRYHTEGGQEKKFHCDKCGLSFLRGYGLKKHTQAVHEHLRPFKCTLCSSAFKTKTHLKYHISAHSNPNSKYRGYNKPK